METVLLLPNAAGDETNITSQFPITGAHWDKVDEEVVNDTDYVIGDATDTYDAWYRDFYYLTSLSGVSGTIEQIKVYVRAKAPANSSIQTNLKIAIKIGVVTNEDTAVTLTNAFVIYSKVWLTNPATGVAWTVSDINTLQIGASLRAWFDGAIAGPCSISQVYVEITNYPTVYGISELTGKLTSELTQRLISEDGIKFTSEDSGKMVSEVGGKLITEE